MDASYAAGFFDGEGCVSLVYIRKRKTVDGLGVIFGFRLVVLVSNTDRPSLERFVTRYGGYIHRSGRRTPNHKEPWTWRLNAAAAQREFLLDVLPYLFTKKKRAELGLEFLDTTVKPGHRVSQDQWDIRRRLAEEIKMLNRRGIEKAPKYPIPDSPPMMWHPSFRYDKKELHRRMKHVRAGLHSQ